MAVLDNPGSLLASLQPFAERGINLHKLESRPCRGKAFEYVFYVDLMAAADDPDVEAALKEVAAAHLLLRVLGSLPIGRRPGLTMADRFESPGQPAQPSVAVVLAVAAALRRGHRGRHDPGAPATKRRAEREPPRAPPPRSRRRRPSTPRSPGLTTFRGNASRSYYGEGPVPLHPVIRWQSPADEKAVLDSVDGGGLERMVRHRLDRASRT